MAEVRALSEAQRLEQAASFQYVLTPGQQRSLELYQLFYEQVLQKKGIAAKPERGQPIFDLEQNVRNGSVNLNPYVATLVTHGLLWSSKLGRPLRPNELVLLQRHTVLGAYPVQIGRYVL